MGPVLLVLAISCAELEHGLPPGLLAAVVLAESGGVWHVTRERKGGCSSGVAQVWHADCALGIRRSKHLAAHLGEAARLLRRSHARCALHPRWRACRLSLSAWHTGLYNSGSVTWGPRVARIWRELMRDRRAPCAEGRVPDA